MALISVAATECHSPRGNFEDQIRLGPGADVEDVQAGGWWRGPRHHTVTAQVPLFRSRFVSLQGH